MSSNDGEIISPDGDISETDDDPQQHDQNGRDNLSPADISKAAGVNESRIEKQDVGDEKSEYMQAQTNSRTNKVDLVEFVQTPQINLKSSKARPQNNLSSSS